MKYLLVCLLAVVAIGCGKKEAKKDVSNGFFGFREVKTFKHEGNGLVLLDNVQVGDEFVLKVKGRYQYQITDDYTKLVKVFIQDYAHYESNRRTSEYDCGLLFREIVGQDFKAIEFNENKAFEIHANDATIFKEGIASESLLIDSSLKEFKFTVTKEMTEKSQRQFKIKIIPAKTHQNIEVGVVANLRNACDTGNGRRFIGIKDPMMKKRTVTYPIPYEFDMEIMHLPRR